MITPPPIPRPPLAPKPLALRSLTQQMRPSVRQGTRIVPRTPTIRVPSGLSAPLNNPAPPLTRVTRPAAGAAATSTSQVDQPVEELVAAPLPSDAQMPSAANARVAAIVAAGQANASTAPTGVTASALRRWLNPTTLRGQFILTEILQAPVGLRDLPGE
jgi:hypothetical protein